eukprot:CAMPEP_0115839786 /NCGR_PEP_ID=MMETSP0287-20121206/6434_1 /TAXON_ID=412157 /ORGANISM="Chrysochromulina rotalis, Strain UIO044" /LENGTH=245 /DNA_ID=CAMNT_0003293375 /DNA_START=1 /DNA_END=738 /DNA_ORIENTATION=+
MVAMFGATMYAIAFNFRRPRQVDIGMLAQMRGMVGYGVVLQHIGMMALGVAAAYPMDQMRTAMIAPFSCLGIWLACALVETNAVTGVFPAFRRWLGEDDEAVFDEADTDGIRYADVPQVKGYRMQRFKCPVPIANIDDWDQQSNMHCLAATVESSVFAKNWEKVAGDDNLESNAADVIIQHTKRTLDLVGTGTVGVTVSAVKGTIGAVKTVGTGTARAVQDAGTATAGAVKGVGGLFTGRSSESH